jgi:hypothetical protein
VQQVHQACVPAIRSTQRKEAGKALAVARNRSVEETPDNRHQKGYQMSNISNMNINQKQKQSQSQNQAKRELTFEEKWESDRAVGRRWLAYLKATGIIPSAAELRARERRREERAKRWGLAPRPATVGEHHHGN